MSVLNKTLSNPELLDPIVHELLGDVDDHGHQWFKVTLLQWLHPLHQIVHELRILYKVEYMIVQELMDVLTLFDLDGGGLYGDGLSRSR
ncbi:MAG: hypothetical protein ACTSWA_03000 [Candidatus Thorarchaeota archaeon]